MCLLFSDFQNQNTFTLIINNKYFINLRTLRVNKFMRIKRYVTLTFQKTYETKMDILNDYRNLKRKYQPLKIEYDIMKNHKLELYKFRENYIKNMKISEDMERFLKFKDNEEDFIKFTEQKIEKLKNNLKLVSS